MALGLTACGGATSSTSGDGGPPGPGGTCSASVPDGAACNTLTNLAPTIIPTCATGTIPTGTGGTIVDGTYFLTGETYYVGANCPQSPVSATIVIAGDCVQQAGELRGSNVAASFTLTVHGNVAAPTATCLPGGTTPSVPVTFTATGSTLTIFTANAATGSNYVEVLTRL
jgi:hypothetical protein